MIPIRLWVILLALLGLFLTGCSASDAPALHTSTPLPAPRVRIATQTPLPTLLPTTMPEVSATPAVGQAQFQGAAPAPLMDDEEFLLLQIDALINDIRHRLRTTNINLKP